MKRTADFLGLLYGLKHKVNQLFNWTLISKELIDMFNRKVKPIYTLIKDKK